MVGRRIEFEKDVKKGLREKSLKINLKKYRIINIYIEITKYLRKKS